MDPEAELNPACAGDAVGWNELRVDYAESRWIRRIERRIQEIRVVEDVEEVGGKLHLDPLGYSGRFPEARVPVPEAKAAQRTVSPIVCVCSKKRRTDLQQGPAGVGEIAQPAAAIRRIACGPDTLRPHRRVHGPPVDS